MRKIKLGNTKVKGMSVKEPKKLTKSPMNGKAAVTKVFTAKRAARKSVRRFRFVAEFMLSSNFWNLVSKVS